MEKLLKLAGWLHNRGMDLYFVGGCVRDEIMGLDVEDMDICIVGGITGEDVQGYLEIMIGTLIDNVTSVHGDFPIWIVEIDGEKYEFAMARKERKTGISHQDFLTEVRDVTIEEDLKRRDLTINAIARNILTGDIIDPYDGIEHIHNKIAHPVSEAFMEDALRVIRAARFIARFDLYPTSQLFHYCKFKIKPEGISNERVGIEVMKMFKTAKTPSKFFYFLKEVGWLNPWFKELSDCIGIPQSPKHHPEGDVWTHTMHCIDAVPKGDWFLRAVMLCHDLGKATHTTCDGVTLRPQDMSDISLGLSEGENWKIGSAGHEEAGVELTRNMLQRIHFCDHATIRKIACLVKLHMIRTVILRSNYDKIIRRTLRELLKYGLTYIQLARVIYFDLAGRPPLPKPTIERLIDELYVEYADELLRNGEMNPIVTGEKLLEIGIPESPEMGKIIRHALELQDRGTLKNHNWKKVLKGAGYPSLQNVEI